MWLDRWLSENVVVVGESVAVVGVVGENVAVVGENVVGERENVAVVGESVAVVGERENVAVVGENVAASFKMTSDSCPLVSLAIVEQPCSAWIEIKDPSGNGSVRLTTLQEVQMAVDHLRGIDRREVGSSVHVGCRYT